ncbi:Glucosidase 2 subunit beta [Liparis tanakae]|uniref:Glucosidase 2 subunit beta n=1 Tax=Liparis tanakae TaxID=230148 RepID=A0A4Z2J583_9TELE|nr:Glucosidase 2 subunit beta [Liparis tanakae]
MWAAAPKDQYRHMVYENGEPCWQGGSRSTTVLVLARGISRAQYDVRGCYGNPLEVTLTCGVETALRSVREPSKCQYVLDLQTPVACQPAPRQRGVHSEL